jgi:hypothetical protein
MSLEQALAKLTSEVELARAATEKNNDLLSRVVEGQQAAMAKLESATVTKVETKGRGKNAKTTETEKPKEEAKPKEVTQDDLKDIALPHLQSLKGDDKTKFTKFLNGMAEHFGCTKLTGPEGISEPEHIAQAVWFVNRVKAGLPVDFNAEYDFTKAVDAPENQSADAAGEAEEDPFA